MLTLNWADGSCVGCGGQASCGGQLVAGPVLSFVGGLQPGSPKLMGTSAPSCVTSPQACISSMLVGKTVVPATLWHSREKEKSLAVVSC